MSQHCLCIQSKQSSAQNLHNRCLTELWILWISANAFLFRKNRRNVKVCGSKSNLSVTTDDFQTQDMNWKLLLCSTDWSLKVYLAYYHVVRLLAAGENGLATRDIWHFFSFSALCNSIKWNSANKTQTFVRIATIIMITWAFTVSEENALCGLLPLKHGVLHAVDQIVDACINICPACTYIYNILILFLSDINENVHKVINIKMC